MSGAVTSIVVAGVGGQGIVTAGDVLAQAAFLSGYAVKKSEVHGMAQRGGSVVAQVRFSPRAGVYSPLIPFAQADFLVGFELLETLRQLDWLRKGGLAVADDMRVDPLTVAAGEGEYPSDAAERIARRATLLMVPGDNLARQAGNLRARSTAVLGALSAFLPMRLRAWDRAIAAVLPERAVEYNLRALRLGRQYGRAACK